MATASPYAGGIPPASSLVGTGLTKTLDVGGSRFGTWSAGGFSPVSYLQTTTARPIAQLSSSPTYPQLGAASLTPSQTNAISASPWSPQSPTFWVVGALAFLMVVFFLKRKGRIK